MSSKVGFGTSTFIVSFIIGVKTFLMHSIKNKNFMCNMSVGFSCPNKIFLNVIFIKWLLHPGLLYLLHHLHKPGLDYIPYMQWKSFGFFNSEHS